MKWECDDYEEWIEQGHPINAEVLELYINSFMIILFYPIIN